MWIHWRSFSPNGSLPSPTLLILHRVHLGVFWQQATQSGRATRKATGNSVTRGWPGLETRIRKIQREERHFQVWNSNPNSPKVSLDCLWNDPLKMIMAKPSFCFTPIPGNPPTSSVDRGNRFWNCCKHGCSSDIRDMAKWNTGDFRMFSGCSFSCFWCFFWCIMAPTLWLYTIFLKPCPSTSSFLVEVLFRLNHFSFRRVVKWKTDQPKTCSFWILHLENRFRQHHLRDVTWIDCFFFVPQR